MKSIMAPPTAMAMAGATPRFNFVLKTKMFKGPIGIHIKEPGNRPKKIGMNMIYVITFLLVNGA